MSITHQSVYEVFEHQKPDLLTHLVSGLMTDEKVVVFFRTREDVHAMTTVLKQEEESVDSLHGKMKPEMREKVFHDFKEGRVRVLMVTEAAARGLDFTGAKYVINFDFSELKLDYQLRVDVVKSVDGECVTLKLKAENALLAKLEQWVGGKIPCKLAKEFSYDLNPLTAKQMNKTVNKKSKVERSKPLQNKKKKWRPKKYGRS